MTILHCIVCRKPYDGTTHCSVMACRACAMFFKRCSAWETIPRCKPGNNKCVPNDSGKISCTACRYQRCIQVGMKLQENARSIKKQLEVVSVNSNNFHLNIHLQTLVPETMPILKQFCYHYALHCNKQKAAELDILREDGEELIVLPGYRRMGYMTQSRSNRLYTLGISAFRDFIKNCFTAFASMDNNAQVFRIEEILLTDTIIHLMMIHYFDLFSSFKTMRTFNDVNTTKMVCSEVMFADLNDIGTFLDDKALPDPMDNKTVKDYFATSWRRYLRTTLPVMHRINITDVEFLAVSALIVWEEENFQKLPHLSNMAKAHRQMIYKDLDYYYKNILRLDNYVERIMNVRELIRTLKRNLVAMMESVHFLKTFNFYKSNEEMWQATEKIVEILEHRT